jgi:cold shock CspA family protein
MSTELMPTAPIPLHITFRGLNPSATIESAIRRQASQLERFSSHVLRLDVIVELPQRNRHTGSHYAIRIEITTPLGRATVPRDPALSETQRDFRVVLRSAFDAADRHLESESQRAPGAESASPHGRVTRLFADARYGFLAAPDGEEIYFHESSVNDAGYPKLVVGSPVSFSVVPDDGDAAIRAARVDLLSE